MFIVPGAEGFPADDNDGHSVDPPHPLHHQHHNHQPHGLLCNVCIIDLLSCWHYITVILVCVGVSVYLFFCIFARKYCKCVSVWRILRKFQPIVMETWIHIIENEISLPMSPSVRLSVGRSIGWSVCHIFHKGREVLLPRFYRNICFYCHYQLRLSHEPIWTFFSCGRLCCRCDRTVVGCREWGRWSSYRNTSVLSEMYVF